MMRTLTAIVLLIVAGGVFFLYTKPTYDSITQTQQQIAQYDAALSKAAELQQLKQTLLAKYNAISPSDLDRIDKMLPDHVDNIALIMDVENLANHYGMTFSNVQISTPSSSDQTSAVGAISSGTGQKYDSITISFGTQGTYDQLLTFMQGLEANLRVVDMVSLSLANGAASQASSGATGQTAGAAAAVNKNPVYSLNVTIKTYWLK